MGNDETPPPNGERIWGHRDRIEENQKVFWCGACALSPKVNGYGVYQPMNSIIFSPITIQPILAPTPKITDIPSAIAAPTAQSTIDRKFFFSHGYLSAQPIFGLYSTNFPSSVAFRPCMRSVIICTRESAASRLEKKIKAPPLELFTVKTSSRGTRLPFPNRERS